MTGSILHQPVFYYYDSRRMPSELLETTLWDLGIGLTPLLSLIAASVIQSIVHTELRQEALGKPPLVEGRGCSTQSRFLHHTQN